MILKLLVFTVHKLAEKIFPISPSKPKKVKVKKIIEEVKEELKEEVKKPVLKQGESYDIEAIDFIKKITSKMTENFEHRKKLTTAARRLYKDILCSRIKDPLAIKLIGCTRLQLMEYLKIDEYPHNDLTIDHIIPLCIFDLEDWTHFKCAVHYTNYQYISSYENQQKDDIWNGQITEICMQYPKIVKFLQEVKQEFGSCGQNIHGAEVKFKYYPTRFVTFEPEPKKKSKYRRF